MPGTDSGETDLRALIAAVRAGDAKFADRLYDAVRPRLVRIALALGVRPDDAADVVQDSLWSAHRNLSGFDEAKSSFEGWLGVILVRRVKNLRRARFRARRALEAVRWIGPRGDRDDHGAVDARLTLKRLLAELTGRQRDVVALYEIGGMSAAEVATILEISPAGVRSIARDARGRLAEAARRLGARGEEDR